MYLEGVKAQYKYQKRRDINPKHFLNLFLVFGFIASFIFSYKSVEFVHQQLDSHYYVQAKPNDSIELKAITLSQDYEHKLYYDEEFYRHEKMSILDKRVYVFEKYFEANNSPLVGHAVDFVEPCDKYGAPKDCISLVAIAKHETNLCKYSISAQMHNCLGWGGGGVNRVTFQSFAQMTDRALNVLVNSYGIERMEDPRLMEKVFCGPQDECIGWGSRVINIMDNINNFAEQLGVGRLR